MASNLNSHYTISSAVWLTTSGTCRSIYSHKRSHNGCFSPYCQSTTISYLPLTYNGAQVISVITAIVTMFKLLFGLDLMSHLKIWESKLPENLKKYKEKKNKTINSSALYENISLGNNVIQKLTINNMPPQSCFHSVQLGLYCISAKSDRAAAKV